MSIPSWVPDAIFYQIFPDRFANGDPNNDPPVTLPWNACAVPVGFMGGDLAGITQHLDYLVDLGVSGIYLNPIFLSPSNHRYNTVDYFRIDPKLGTLDDFHTFIDAAHKNGIRVVLDGVFNHTGRGFFAFNDILENGKNSPYLDWYHVKQFPLYAYSPGEAKNYDAWWGFKSLPKLNTSNAKVREYIFSVARYWIEQGADGWRLDVPNEIDDDAFWDEFRRVVLTANPEAYLIGEIWDALPRWVNDRHFDGLMDYPFRTATLGLLAANWSPSRYAAFIEKLLATYPRENNFAMLVLLGSHDVERVLTMVGGNVDRAKLAALIQFAYPGVPSIYYGDEVGLTGGKDPECRGGFPWDRADWNVDLHDWYHRLAHLRRDSLALRRGEYVSLQADDASGLYAFARVHPEETVAVVINASDAPRTLNVPVDRLGWAEGRAVTNLLDGSIYAVVQGKVSLSMAAWSGAVLR